ncbi:MAG: hypothetical protein H7Z12_17865 [Rhodospirillaceae bacterium]|nr:hypothetical protein [Rhodospirillales bacterium]
MNIIAKLAQRVVETASLWLKQSAELNRRLSSGQVSGRGYVREAAAIWRYNLKNFWHPEPDPAHSAKELVGRY